MTRDCMSSSFHTVISGTVGSIHVVQNFAVVVVTSWTTPDYRNGAALQSFSHSAEEAIQLI